jgi:hypothetical protein
MAIIRLIDHAIYPRKAINEARAAYKSFCHVKVEPLSGERIRLTIDVLPEHQGNEREVALSFMNFALDMSSDIHLQNDM